MSKAFTLNHYINLIRAFLEHKISLQRFEQDYFQSFKNDETLWDGEKFDILNGLFSDLDSLCIELSLRDEGDLDEDQLRRNCNIALTKLISLGNLSK